MSKPKRDEAHGRRATFAQFLLLEAPAAQPTAQRRGVSLPCAGLAGTGAAGVGATAAAAATACRHGGAAPPRPPGLGLKPLCASFLDVGAGGAWSHEHPALWPCRASAFTAANIHSKAAEAAAAAGGAKDVNPAYKDMHGAPRFADGASLLAYLAISAAVGAAIFASFGLGRRKEPAKDSEPDTHGAPSQHGTKPTIETACAMANDMYELSNDTLIILATQGSHDACAERLVRDIMRADQVDWAKAREKLTEVDQEVTKHMQRVTCPYVFLIGASVTAGALAIPWCYSRTLAEWTNHILVASDVAEPANLKTIWEVSAWSWNWMEPLLGVTAFTILCIQLTRGMMEDIDILPYHERMKAANATRIAGMYPRYSRKLIRDFVTTATMHRETHLDADWD